MRGPATLIVGAAVVAAGAGWLAARDVPGSQVHVEGGLLSGTATPDGRVRIFRGVPYAAPPVGPLRWRAPEPAAHWTDPSTSPPP